MTLGLDAFGRITARETEAETATLGVQRAQQRYGYYKDGDKSYDRIAAETYRYEDKRGIQEETLRYRYDGAGNISKITRGDRLVARYTYDACNRLVREDNGDRRKTMVYTYDAGGNMTGKLEYVLTLGDTEAMDSFRNPMRYDPVHPDRMRSYCYEKCEYDAMGRPLLYRDNPCTWERIKNL